MSTPAPSDDGFHVVVADDGSVPAEALARLGVRPGAHLRLVPESLDEASKPRRSARGSLAHLVSAGDVAAFVTAREEAKAERSSLLDP